MSVQRQNSTDLPLRLLLLAALGLPLLGCTESESRVPTLRFAETAPETDFRRSELLESQRLASWPFTAAGDLDAWELNVAPEDRAFEGPGLRLSSERRYVTLERGVELDAAEIDSFELWARDLSRQPVTLEWSGPGQQFTDERKIEVDLGRSDGASDAYRMVTTGHPLWQGPITRLRFGLILRPHRPGTLERIDVLADTLHPAELTAALERPWRIDIANQVRIGHLVTPERPLVREVDVPRGGELRLSYALEGNLRQTFTFRATAIDAGGERHTLFADEVAGSQTGWCERSVDLSAWPGSRVRLELAAETAGDFDPRVGFPVWANTEVLGHGTAKPNVVLLSIDTLRSDHLSLYGYERQTSPALDAWARSRAVVFDNAVAASPWTLPSHVSIFTGLDAHRHGVNFGQPASESTLFLAEILRDAGYTTLAVTGGGFTHPRYGFAQGFDRYGYYGFNMGTADELEGGLAQTLELLESHAGRPFFLFFHTYEVHNPFRPRQPHLSRLTGRETAPAVDVDFLPESAEDAFRTHRRLIPIGDGLPEMTTDEVNRLAIDLYDSEIAYTDTMIAQLFAKLEELGIDARTIVVLTSDHGELFGEHGEVNHYSVYEENLAIPLVIAAPEGRWAGRRVAEQARSVDLVPTVLELAGLDPPPGIDGVSLLGAIEGKPEGDGLAWSYAANSNYGLSVRYRGRLRYTFANSAWRTRLPAETLLDLQAGEGAEGSSDVRDESALRLRRLAEGELTAEAIGLRLLISNLESADPLTVDLRGGMIQPARVKALRVGHGVLIHEDDGVASVEIAAGERLFLAVEGPGVSPLTLTLKDDGGRELTTRVDARALASTHFAIRGERGWEEGEMALPPSYDEPPGDGIYLWWHRRGAEGEAVEIDEDLRRQLEALGYVE